MAIWVRPYVTGTTHVEGCNQRHCGPGCVRVTDGFEYHLKLKLPNGELYEERKKSPVSGKSTTQRYAEERARHLVRFGIPDKTVTAPTVEEFRARYIREHCEASRLKPSTIAQKNVVLDHYIKSRLGDRRLDQIRDQDIARLKADLKDLSPKTVNNVLVTLSTMLKAAREWGVIPYLPCTIKLLKVSVGTVEFYEQPDYERLVAAARELDPRIELLVLLGGDAGLRRGEIIALEQTDCDTRRGILHVRRSEWKGHVTLPKGGRERQVNMTDRLRAVLTASKHLRGERVLWRDDGYDKVTAVLFAKWMRRAQRRAGLKVTGGLHILRHTFCSRLAMAGAPALAIKELAGHTTLATTMRYMHLSPAAKSAAIELLNHEVVGDIRETAQEFVKNP
jgi:integrase